MIMGCLPKGLASEEGIENPTVFNMDFAREENPAENIRNKQKIISTYFAPVVRHENLFSRVN